MQIPYRCTYAKQLLWKISITTAYHCMTRVTHHSFSYVRNQCILPAPDYVLQTCQDNYNKKTRKRVDDKTQATVLRKFVIVLICTTTHTIPTTNSVKTIELTGYNHSLLIITCLN